MRCIICDSDSWKNVDDCRIKPENMCVCTKCGFVTYPDLNEEKLKEYYREEYRTPPNANHFFTGEKKLNYHGFFLNETLDEWNKRELKKPVFCDVGCAFGMFPNFIKRFFPEADSSGVELTLAYRRVAWHEFGIQVLEEIDKTKKYDLISSYKVLEHQMDADKRLREYTLLLNEGDNPGHMYVSVPTWFNELANFGVGGWDIEYYYHKNHINVWSRKLFEVLLKKVGLEIVKEDHVLYGNTYLCMRNDSLMEEKPQYEDPDEVVGWMKTIKAANEKMKANQYGQAIKLWPRFPHAHFGHYETSRNKFGGMPKEDAFAKIEAEHLNPLKKHCGDNLQTVMFLGDISMRYEQYEKAINHYAGGLKIDPTNAGIMMQLAQCHREMAMRTPIQADQINNYHQARILALRVKQISSRLIEQTLNWSYNDAARIPAPFEGTTDGTRTIDNGKQPK